MRGMSASWLRQGQAWDPFVKAMWNKFRHNLPPAVTPPGRTECGVGQGHHESGTP